MIITLTGTNNFLLLQHMKKLITNFTVENGDLAIERIDASDALAQTIIDAVSSLPFLSNKKMVVLRELGTNKIASEKIEQIIYATEDTTELIIYEPSPDKRTSYYKSLVAKTKVEEFKELDSHQLTAWLVEQGTKLQAKLSISDAKFLVERVGLNQAILSSELEKLSLYDKHITKETIELLTEKTPQSKIFDLLDAAFSGNRQRAFELYEDQRTQKVEPQAILALIIWQLHLIALAKFGAGKSSAQIAVDAKLNPYPISKAQNLARGITTERLREIVDEVGYIDYESKTSAIDIDEALKNLVLSLQ